MQIIPVITGIGLVTPLGRSATTTFDALLAGRFITDHTRLESNNPKKIPRVISLAIESANEAIAQAGWSTNRQDIAVVACTSKGSIESWMDSHLSSAVFGLADLSTKLANHIGSTAARLCLSSACASGLHGLIRGAMMIQSGQAKRVLIVAAEASAHPLFIASFNRLGVLVSAGELCRPFDVNRTGFLMSEAAAGICLEAADDENKSRAFAAVDRYALGGDAAHLTRSDPFGLVLRYLLDRVIGQEAVDLIHAHGTGTISNDSTELTALDSNRRGSGPDREGQPHFRPILYSHKAALGHTLGASGLLAIAINCVCHRAGIVPGNINTKNPLPCDTLHIETGITNAPIHRSVIHAAGFGGPTAVVSLRRI